MKSGALQFILYCVEDQLIFETVIGPKQCSTLTCPDKARFAYDAGRGPPCPLVQWAFEQKCYSSYCPATEPLI